MALFWLLHCWLDLEDLVHFLDNANLSPDPTLMIGVVWALYHVNSTHMYVFLQGIVIFVITSVKPWIRSSVSSALVFS